MSSPDDKPKPPAAVQWATIMRVADEADRAEAAERAAMSDEAIDAELAAAGFDPGDADALVLAALGHEAKPVAAPEVPARAAPVAPRRSRWAVLAIAAAVALVAVLVWKRDAVVALFERAPEPIGPDRPPGPPVSTPRPQREQAMRIREQAYLDCGASQWVLCQDELDHASALDPAGDTDPNVQHAREKIAAGLAVPTPLEGPKQK